MRTYRNEYGLYFIDPEDFSKYKVENGLPVFAREVFSTPILNKIGLYDLLRLSSDKDLEILEEQMSNCMFYCWKGDIIYENENRPIYFESDIKIEGNWFPVEDIVKEAVLNKLNARIDL